jgi:hypothetical protein
MDVRRRLCKLIRVDNELHECVIDGQIAVNVL